jgi:hypothetical protein
MKRPQTAVPKSARTARAGVPRSREDAAVQLVRLEFDLGRLRRAIDLSERRSAADRQVYAEKDRRRRALMKILNG